MTIKNFFKLQVFALLFAATISPLSALAAPTTIKFVLGTKEVISNQSSCTYNLGGTITGIGTGTITVKGQSKPLGVLTLTANDCITPLNPEFTRLSAEGSLTLTAGKGNTITALYSTDFSQTDDPNDDPFIYEYKNFNLTITGGTGFFKEASGSGIVEGASNIQTGQGVIIGTMYISK